MLKQVGHNVQDCLAHKRVRHEIMSRVTNGAWTVVAVSILEVSRSTSATRDGELCLPLQLLLVINSSSSSSSSGRHRDARVRVSLADWFKAGVARQRVGPISLGLAPSACTILSKLLLLVLIPSR